MLVLATVEIMSVTSAEWLDFFSEHITFITVDFLDKLSLSSTKGDPVRSKLTVLRN